MESNYHDVNQIKFILRILLIIKMRYFYTNEIKTTNEETIIEGDQFEYKKIKQTNSYRKRKY